MSEEGREPEYFESLKMSMTDMLTATSTSFHLHYFQAGFIAVVWYIIHQGHNTNMLT
jgi:hypothetical protein